MPLEDIHFENNIFFCREVGLIDRDDARQWAQLAEKYARAASPLSIIALIDATQVSSISLEARRILAKASAINGLAYASVAAKDDRTAQTSRIVGLMAVDRHTYVFNSLLDARAFAELKIAELNRTGV